VLDHLAVADNRHALAGKPGFEVLELAQLAVFHAFLGVHCYRLLAEVLQHLKRLGFENFVVVALVFGHPSIDPLTERFLQFVKVPAGWVLDIGKVPAGEVGDRLHQTTSDIAA